MNPVARGVRNAFRNSVRTIAIVVILGLSIGLSLTMLVANKAVENKIDTVKRSIGNTISISAAGTNGFQGGGNPLSETTVNKLTSLANVSSVTETISDQLRNSTNTSRDGTTTSANTSLTSSIDAGRLGNRFGGGGSTSTTSTTSTTGIMPGGGGGGFTPPISAYGTTDATKLSGSSITIKSGTALDGTADKAVAMVGTTLATKNSLKVGSTFTAYGTTITVVAIYDAGTTFENNSLIFSLPTLQRLSSQTGELTSAVINVNSVTNIDSVTTAAKNILGTTADVTSSKDSVASAIEPLNSVKKVSTFSLIGATVAGAVIILLTMIMIVRERKREIGVVKAIGGSNLKIVSEFMVESLTLAIMGAVIGLIIGVAGGQPVTKLLVNNSTSTTTTATTEQGPGGAGGGTTATRASGTTRTGGFGGLRRGVENNQAIKGISNIKAQIGLSILAYGFGAALLIAVIGSALAAGMIAKVRPSNVMRAE